MGDIELIIKIPEEVKNKIDNATENNYRIYIWWFETTLYCAIKDSIPLPKEHGDLIDRNNLTPDTEWDDYYDGFISYSESQIKNATAIIEADETESEGVFNARK